MQTGQWQFFYPPMSKRPIHQWLIPVTLSYIAATSCRYSPCLGKIHNNYLYTDKIENQIFIIKKEIQNGQQQSHIGLTASSYMGKYLRISSYIRNPFSYMALQPLHSEFPYIHEENLIFFFICVLCPHVFFLFWNSCLNKRFHSFSDIIKQILFISQKRPNQN